MQAAVPAAGGALHLVAMGLGRFRDSLGCTGLDLVGIF